jgi:DNA-binding XRE family transcriptional regulator
MAERGGDALEINAAGVRSQPVNPASPLARFRRRHCLTQAEAAAAVGIGSSTWRQLEGGWRGREPPRSLLLHLAALDALASSELDWPKGEDTWRR